MSKLITSTGWYGIPGNNRNSGKKVHMLADGSPVCGAKPKGEYQWCSHGANYQYTDCELCRRYYRKHEANESIMAPKQVITDVVNCARCGGVHKTLSFRGLLRPQGRYTHWAPCPVNHQPILLKIV